jgi:GAF domain-containing protein
MEALREAIPHGDLPAGLKNIRAKRTREFVAKISRKTKAQLISEVEELRLRNVELEAIPIPDPCVLDENRELRVKNRILDILLTVSDDFAYRSILDVILEATESRHGVIGYIDEDGAFVAPCSGGGLENGISSTRFLKDSWGDTAGARAILENRTIWSNDPSGDVPPPYIPMRRQISTPIVHKNKVLGLIQIANKDVDYASEDIMFMESIAAAIAPGLELRLARAKDEHAHVRADKLLREAHRKLEERFREVSEERAGLLKELKAESESKVMLESSFSRLQTLLNSVLLIGGQIPTHLDEITLVSNCVEAAQRFTGSRFGYFGRLNVGRLNVSITTVQDEEEGASVRIDDMEARGVWAKVIEDGCSLRLNDVVSETDDAVLPEGNPPLTSVLAVPVRKAGEVFGVIALANKFDGYDADDQVMLESVAKLAASIIAHKKTVVALHEARQELLRQEGLMVLAQLTGGETRTSSGRKGWLGSFVRSCLRRDNGRSKGGRSPLAKAVMNVPRKVLVASPRPVFLDAVNEALGEEAEIISVATTDIDDVGLSMAKTVHPEVVVVDMTSVGMSGLRAISALREQLYYALLVAVSPVNSKSIKIAARECGADNLIMGDFHSKTWRKELRGAVLSS